MRRKAGTTEAIIRDHAIKIIVKEGFDGFSMSKLAKAADLSVAAIYIYYVNKEDLLNKLFAYVQASFSECLLTGASVDDAFTVGLWTIWENYVGFAIKSPEHFIFFDLFRNSHLIDNEAIRASQFNQHIERFARHAIDEGQIRGMEPELFWSLAFGPVNALIKFHLDKTNSYTGEPFQISRDNLRYLFERVVAGFAKS